MRFWLPLILGLGLSACATTQTSEVRTSLPASLLPNFSSCTDIDGAGTLRLFQREGFAGSAEMEFLATADGWNMRIGDPSGAEYLHAVFQQGRTGEPAPYLLNVGGPVADRLPELSLEDSGMIRADGHFTGLRASEVPCFGKTTFPQTWLAMKARIDHRPDGILMTVIDSARVIFLSIPSGTDANGLNSLCAEIESSSIFSFFQPRLQWCISALRERQQGAGQRGGRQASLRGLRDYEINWRPYEP